MITSNDPQSWNWLRRALQPTRWSLVERMRRRESKPVAATTEEFCRCYWYPLYSFLRHSGYERHDAQDYVQSFLASLLSDDLLNRADPARGRLRNFLITLLTRHIADLRERSSAKKRGGGATHLPLDWAAAEASYAKLGRTAGSPEEAYRQALAVRLVQDGIEAVREAYAQNGNAALLEELLPALDGPLSDGTCSAIANRFGMKPNTVNVAISRMRQRFQKEVKSAAAVLLGIPEGPLLDAELKDLFCGPPRHASL